MAGYLAASMSETGAVCTFGGAQVPPVLIFMVGFEHGVLYYNEQNGANVQVLGWQTDPANGVGGEGTFIGSYTDQDAGRAVAENFFDQGCDVIFPVAGGAGLGSAAAAQERGLAVIGVDADQTQTAPEYADVYLTSVLKRIDAVVFEAVRLIHEGTYEGGVNFIGTLTNSGVGLAPFHSYEDQVPEQVQADLAEIEQGIIDGTISTGWPIMQSGGIAASAAKAVPVDARITPQMLQNAEYPNEFTQNGAAPLVDGEYREPAAPGSAMETVVTLSDVAAYGDLNEDGFEDAAVVTITDPGGSGTFYTLVAVLDKNGLPASVATVALGDRIKLNSLNIESGAIVVDMVTQGPDDALANPTQPVVRTYALQYSLAEAGSQTEAAGNGNDFAGAYQATMAAASSPGREITLTLDPAGTVQMSTDFLNDEPPIVETGSWVDNGDGTATVTLTGRDDGTMYDEPTVIIFELADGQLTAVDYDESLFGSAGLTLEKQ